MNAAQLLFDDAPLARHGARIALLCGEERVTFSELAARLRRAAGALASYGVRPGDRVLLLMRDTPDFAAAWLGAVYAGSVAIALNNKISEADYRHILRDSGARLVIVEDVFAAVRPDLTAELAREGRLAAAWQERCRNAKQASAFDALPEAPAFGLYTSGTTGQPKGILHSHKAFLSLGQAFREFGIGAGERVFTTSKLFFAYGLEHALLGTLALGATSILFADWPDTEAVIELVARHQPAALFSVPTVYRRLLAEPAARLAPFRSVRRFVAGGERLSPQLVEHWKRAVGGELLNLYGMSETFSPCMTTPPGTSDGTRTGKPLAGVAVRLDAQGVLWVKHPAQASGYANLPQQTREQFRDGWFCTRDVFMRDVDGFFVHQGRSDELVKIAGQWVQPGELEEAAALEPAIAEAACVLVPDADGLDRLALFVTARGDTAAALRAAAEACELRLPRHKRPKWVRAVAELPRTATGKVQRYKLREILARELARKD
ncbi:MAG TPA: AMP-binding protein [Burkholderiales bacterium]|nr:AMP-binding protein [Burkholderiales bacterium]